MSGLDPALHRRWITTLVNAVRAVQEQGFHEVVLCSEAARPLVKSGTGREIPHLAVISSLEVASDVTVESLGEIRLEAPVGSLETQRMPPPARLQEQRRECNTLRSRPGPIEKRLKK